MTVPVSDARVPRALKLTGIPRHAVRCSSELEHLNGKEALRTMAFEQGGNRLE